MPTMPKSLIGTGDGLYSKQPFIDSLKDAGMAFIIDPPESRAP